MLRTAGMLNVALALAFLVLIGSGPVKAQSVVVSPPVVPYYTPQPAVTYYSPSVVYAPPATVAYYYSLPVSYTSYYLPSSSVSYYTPAVSYYAPPEYTRSVSYYTPRVSASYYTRSVSYYTPPVSYATPTAVTTTRYGLLGRPRVSTTYYTPVYVSP